MKRSVYACLILIAGCGGGRVDDGETGPSIENNLIDDAGQCQQSLASGEYSREISYPSYSSPPRYTLFGGMGLVECVPSYNRVLCYRDEASDQAPDQTCPEYAVDGACPDGCYGVEMTYANCSLRCDGWCLTGEICTVPAGTRLSYFFSSPA